MMGPRAAAGVLGRFGRPFLLLWIAELVLATGGAVTDFAVHAWVYTRSGSLLSFSFVIAAGTLTTITVLFFSGFLADRIDRRTLILSADAFIVLAMGTLAGLAAGGALMVWHLYVFTIGAAVAGAFRGPAYRAALSSFLHNGNFSQAGGLLSMSVGVTGIVVPLVASGAMARYGLAGVLAINIVAIVLSALLVNAGFAVAPPARAPERASARPRWAGIKADLLRTVGFFREHKAMRILLVYCVVQGCFVALAANFITPLILARYTLHDLAVIMTCGGAGALLGAIPLFIPGIARRLAVGLLISDAALALCLIFVGIADSITQYSLCAFCAMFAGSAAAGCAHAIWMQKAPLERQGSIFALVEALALISVSVVTMLAGGLVDGILAPAFAPGGMWSGDAGHWPAADQGQGRGLALLFLACGVLGLVASLGGLAHKGIRNIDKAVPDGRQRTDMTI